MIKRVWDKSVMSLHKGMEVICFNNRKELMDPIIGLLTEEHLSLLSKGFSVMLLRAFDNLNITFNLAKG